MRRTLALSVVFVWGCLGSIGDPVADDNAPSGGIGAGNTGGASEVLDETTVLGPSDLRRLTRLEYENTLRDLFGDEIVDDIATSMASLPSDAVDHGFRSMSLAVTSNHVDGYFEVADRLSEQVTVNADRLGALETCLADSTINNACVAGFVDGFGRRVFRRPVSEEEQSLLLASYADGVAISPQFGVKLVVLQMLQSPPFLYRVEIAGAPIDDAPNTYELSEYELATRLSYFAWGSTPDDELLDAAESGSLDTQQGRAIQIDRLIADPRARRQVSTFFREWLESERIPEAQQSSEFLAGIDGSTLADDVRAELERYVLFHVFDTDGTFADLMTSNLAFPGSQALASVYGASGPGEALELLDGHRNGLLTRAGILLGSGESTHPVQRGAFVRRKVLCDPIPPPDPTRFPPNTIVPPAFDPDKTARDRWTEKTSGPACSACHVRINPLGYVLENYDSLGRYRTAEAIIDPSSGDEVNLLTIDSRVELQLDDSPPIQVSDSAALGEAIAASPRANDCFARQWFRYVEGREERADDRQVIDALVETTTHEGGSMLQMLRKIAETPQFRRRLVKP